MDEQNREQRPLASFPNAPAQQHRDAIDADNVKQLKANPEERDGQLDINLDETFPASDPPAITQPRHSTDPAPGGKYD
jgi:hypothetical protein